MKINLKYVAIVFCFLAFAAFTAKAQDSNMKSKSVNVNKGDNLKIKLGYGDIHLQTWDKNEVMVSYNIDEDEGTDGIELTKDGNTVSIRTKYDSQVDINEIMIPSYLSIDAKTDGGSVDVKGGLNADFSVKTSGGNITFQNIRGNVDIKTAGGSIASSDIKGTADITTAGGDIRLGNISGGEVESSGGNIEIGNSGKKIEIKAGGGNISVGNVNGDISVGTGGGNVDIGEVKNSVDVKTGGGNIDLKRANGEVSAITGGGNATLRNINGSVDVQCGAGNITVELTPSGKSDSKINSGQGDIYFYIPANAKATIIAKVKTNSYWTGSDDNNDYIKSDFPATTFDKRDSGVNAVYKLNGGGVNIYLKTSVGQILIKKLSK
jgi:hypothetical protein